MRSAKTGYGVTIAVCALTLVGSMAVVARTSVRGGSASPSTSVAGSRSGAWMMGGSMMGAGRAGAAAPVSCAAPTNLPGTTVQVVLGDMGMSRMRGGASDVGVPMWLRTSTDNVAAGPVSFVVANVGSRTHELVILPVADGSAAGGRLSNSQGKVDEAGSLGEASESCGAGVGEGITSGRVGWVTVTLPAGRYELVCNEPHHDANGMWQELDVA